MIRRVLQIVRWALPLIAVVVILYVVHGVGVPLSLPGIVLVVLLLFAARLAAGWLRRRRRRRPRD